MLTKEQFTYYINGIIKAEEADDKINELFSGDYIHPESGLLFELLTTIMKDEGEWISYFLYDLDRGKQYKPGVATEADGTNIPLATIDDLYTLLTEDKV